jgi:hypothetical protein
MTNDEVVSWQATVRAGMPESRDGAVDKPWIVLAQRGVPNAELICFTRAEVFDHHIARLGEMPDHCQSLRGLQVHGNGSLVAVRAKIVRAVAIYKRRPPSARLVTLARVLHLDDVSAKVRQQHGAQRPRQNPGEVEDPYAFERC